MSHDDIADAVVTRLNAGTFNPSFTAAKKLLPVYQLEDAPSLSVDVVVGSQSRERMTRGTVWLRNYTVSVIVRAKCDATSNAEIEPLEALGEAIKDHIQTGTWTGGVVLAEVNQEIPFSVERAIDNGIFSTQIDFVFRSF